MMRPNRLAGTALCLLVVVPAGHAQARAAFPRERAKEILEAELDPKGAAAEETFGAFPVSTWPREASAAFDARFKEKWNVVEKRDFLADGIPTALLVRGTTAPADQYQLIVTEMTLVKWTNGKWKELLRLDLKDGLVLGQRKFAAPLPAGSRGYAVSVIGENDSWQHEHPYLLALAVSARDDHDAAVPQITKKRIEIHYFGPAKGYAVTDGPNLVK